MKFNALWIAVATFTVALAGCADSGATGTSDNVVAGKVDETAFKLSAGKGAIAGLLVDDRFRPIQLTDDPQTEFQAGGFILLQELGLRAQTSENGEFTFVDLEPGTYTIRVNADGHEAVPQKVSVEEGLFAELNVVARRLASDGSFVVTEEYTGFAACGFSALTSLIGNCVDTSGESDRRGYSFNFTTYQNVTYLIMEVRVDDPGRWTIQVAGPGRSPQYGNIDFDGLYGKGIYENGGLYDDTKQHPWNNDLGNETGVLMFYGGSIANPTGDRCFDETQFTNYFCTSGFGAAIGQRVRFLASAFVGEPEVNLEAYEALTADST